MDLISHPSEKWNNKKEEEFWIKHAATVFKWTLESIWHIWFEEKEGKSVYGVSPCQQDRKVKNSMWHIIF